jgi:predicted alpha/beta hydrolase family esterase
MSSPVLTFPGIGDSGPEHWQSIWEQSNPEIVRISQRDWDNPVCEEWASALERTVSRLGSSVVVVAHSFVGFQEEGTPGFQNHGTLSCRPASDRAERLLVR